MKIVWREFLHWPKYAHYLLLAGGVFLIHYLTGIYGIEQYAIDTPIIGMPILFLSYAIGLLIIDTFLHIIMGIFHKEEPTTRMIKNR